jgi:hypothetical protein
MDHLVRQGRTDLFVTAADEPVGVERQLVLAELDDAAGEAVGREVACRMCFSFTL